TKSQALRRLQSGTEKSFTNPSLPRALIPSVRCREAPRGDLRGQPYAADLFRQDRGASRFARCLAAFPVVSLRQARLLNLIDKGSVTDVQHIGGLTAVPFILPQNLQDHVALHLADCLLG